MVSAISGGSGWIFLAAAFFGLLFFLVFVRRMESRRLENKFDQSRIIITSFGVNYFGLKSESGRPARSSGALVLLRDGLYYRARFSRRELYIPGNDITSIRVVDAHKGRPLYQKAVAVGFTNSRGEEDTAAFRIPLPARWIEAIKRNLIQGNL